MSRSAIGAVAAPGYGARTTPPARIIGAQASAFAANPPQRRNVAAGAKARTWSSIDLWCAPMA